MYAQVYVEYKSFSNKHPYSTPTLILTYPLNGHFCTSAIRGCSGWSKQTEILQERLISSINVKPSIQIVRSSDDVATALRIWLY